MVEQAPPMAAAGHSCRLLGSPVQGLHATEICSVRSYERHSHDTFGVGVVEEGAQRSWSGRGGVEAFAGDVITTNPGEVHDGRPHEGGASRRWRMVYLDPAALAAFAFSDEDDGRASRIRLTQPVIHDTRLARQARHLFDGLAEWARARPEAAAAHALACDEATARLCGLLLRRHGTQEASRFVGMNVRDARDRLAANLLSPPTLAELAAPLGLSKFQLLRAFEKAYGLPPHRWLVQQRVHEARSLIARGAALGDAAAASGFCDQSHMHRSFVAQLGFTPGAWQRSRRA